MQQALLLPQTTTTAPAPQRGANKVALTAAAMMCTGALAVSPISPSVPSPVSQQPAVQLAAWVNPILENPLSLWQATFTNSFTQLGAIGDSLSANPFPVLNQLADNQAAHLKVILGAKAAAGQRRGTGIIGSAEAVGRSIENLPVRLQAASDFLKNGEVTEALVEINTWAWVFVENLGLPLLPVLGIPGAMFDAVGRVYDSLVTRGNVVGIMKGVAAPVLGVAFALSNVVDQVIRSMKSGDLEEAMTAVVNAPALAMGALLNGYKPFFGYDANGEPILSPEFFPGVFSAGGTIDSLFVTLPRTIAAALAPPLAATAVTSVPSTASTLVSLEVTPAPNIALTGPPSADAASSSDLDQEAGVADFAVGEGTSPDAQSDVTLDSEADIDDVVADDAEEITAESSEADELVADEADAAATDQGVTNTAVTGDQAEAGDDSSAGPQASTSDAGGESGGESK